MPTPPPTRPPALRKIPYMGVIHVLTEAMELGFWNGHPDWCNLGQGQPEVGPMEGAPARLERIDLAPSDHAYGPVQGLPELRERIASHYNRLYRPAGRSQYTAEHVGVAAGGRLTLSRVFTALGSTRLGYQVPDYTAYEDMLAAQMDRIEPVPLFARREDGFALPAQRLARAVREERLDAFLLSNPCNPTGKVIAGAELEAYVALARDPGVTLLLDEFYSQFIYDGERPGAGPVSAARHVEDVDHDPVLIVDGLTKSFRYPGWRLGWVVGPPELVDCVTRTASALDGGPSVPIQRAAIEVLEPGRADQETTALRRVFSRKRNLTLQALEAMGVRCAAPPEGTFYLWGSVEGLPEPLNDPEVFYRRALERRVVTVPGIYFDVNPGKLRQGPSPLASWMRFSFGPPEPNLVVGLQRLSEMVEEQRRAR